MQVARRVRALEYLQGQEGKAGRGHRAVRYRACSLDEDIYLHPTSSLSRRCPEYVIYTDLLRTEKRPYMSRVTAIDPQWLADSSSPLRTVSEPLEEPAPQYRPRQDAVICWRNASYGRHAWPLPLTAGQHPDPAARAAAFAAALLGGKVLPSFKGDH